MLDAKIELATDEINNMLWTTVFDLVAKENGTMRWTLLRAALRTNSCGKMMKVIRPATGFTLAEILIAIAVVAILVSVAVVTYSQYLERTRVANAQFTIRALAAKITLYEIDARAYPVSLAQLGADPLDPWGRPYVYLDLTTIKGKGAARKDRNLYPLNTDFDLYSLGKDGVSKAQITNKESLDDVIRASDGAFVDLAKNF